MSVTIKSAPPGLYLNVTDDNTGIENEWAITLEELQEIIEKGQEAITREVQEQMKSSII